MARIRLFKYCYTLVIWAALTAAACGQELNAMVHVDRSQINNISLTYLDNLAGQVQTYLNNYSWTNDTFQSYEKINAVFQITLLSAGSNHNFTASIVIQSFRPIYDSSQQTMVFQYHDRNWAFHYTPNSDFVHDKLQFNSITTLLDYYAYIILGYDYDTFSLLGGTPYFNEAQNLVSLAQTSSSPGWNRAGNQHRNRASLVSYLLNPNYRPLRKAEYVYHRKGLDLFLKDPNTARKNIIKALQLIQKAQNQTSNSLLFDIFFNAKASEMVAIFKDASPDIRLQAYNIFSDLDPTHLSDYNKLQ
jgi:hypothetical protein